MDHREQQAKRALDCITGIMKKETAFASDTIQDIGQVVKEFQSLYRADYRFDTILQELSEQNK